MPVIIYHFAIQRQFALSIKLIAKYFNQGGIHSQEMRAAINQCITELYEMKYKVTKMAGVFHGDTETHSK